MKSKSQMRTLPVYRVATWPLDAAALRRVGSEVFGWRHCSTAFDGERLVLRSGSQVVDSYPASGSVWAADEAVLWNQEERPTLPRAATARAAAADLLARLGKAGLGATSTRGQPVRLRESPAVVGTRVCRRSVGKRGTRRTDLDLIVRYDHRVRASLGAGRAPASVPVIGGGGKIRVTFGDRGRVIGFSAAWRPIVGVVGTARLRSREEVLDEHRATLDVHGHARDTHGVRARLAYYCAPPMTGQALLVPVWALTVVGGEAEHEMCPRVQYVPADPAWRFAIHEAPLPRRATVPEFRRSLQSPYTVGASWCGVSGRGSQGPANAARFVETAMADGASVVYHLPEPDTQRRLWLDGSAAGVDAAQLVFHTGHASARGWSVTPDVTGGPRLVLYDQTGTVALPARWGSGQLSCMVIAGCGPLEDDSFNHGGGDAIVRWAGTNRAAGGAFQGLHGLLGYGSSSQDSDTEGGAFLSHAVSGATLKDAWFRAARETQPIACPDAKPPYGPDLWAAGLFAKGPGGSGADDHLWGHGSVCPDPVPATEFELVGTRM